MSEEQQNVAAEIPAPEQDTTVTPEPVVSTPEEKPVEEKPTRTFTQEELDAAIGKRLAREQRKWEREQAARLAEFQAKQQSAQTPSVDQFETPEAYAEALAERKAQELIAKREADRQRSEIVNAYHEREEEARTKYDDFEQVAYNPKLSITPVMAETIQASEVGPDVIYYLGVNPKEAERISRLMPYLQAKEIGKLEAKLASDPPAKKTTAAPAPIAPVSARSVGSPVYDTTDPRSVKHMSTSEWIEADRLRQIKKLEAQRSR